MSQLNVPQLKTYLTQIKQSCFNANDNVQYVILKSGKPAKFFQPLVDSPIKRKVTRMFLYAREERE